MGFHQVINEVHKDKKNSDKKDSDEVTAQSQTFLWFIIGNETDAYSVKFTLYSLFDHKFIYEQTVKTNPDAPIKDIIFDKDNKYIYILSDEGLILSDILWQQQDQQDSLINYIDFFDLRRVDLENYDKYFEEAMRNLTIYPQFQNMYHLCSIQNETAPLLNHFTYAAKKVPYCSDMNGLTPLSLAYKMKNDNV